MDVCVDKEDGAAKAKTETKAKNSNRNFFTVSERIRRGLCDNISTASLTHRCIPTERAGIIDVYKGRVYGGRFVNEGENFITSCQDRYIRVYDTNNNWKVVQRIITRSYTRPSTSASITSRFPPGLRIH